MVSSTDLKVSLKRCLGTSIESFIGSSPSEQIIKKNGAVSLLRSSFETEEILTLFDMGEARCPPPNVSDHCAQTLRRRKLFDMGFF